MAKKRRRSAKEGNDKSPSKEDVEKEEQAPNDQENDDMEEDEEDSGVPSKVVDARNDDEIIPFLDSFYGLSSSDPQERSVSAQAMLYHSLLGPQANIKDATYALKRLLNGLCSSRASSRPGYAAALASFLKLTFSLGTIKDIQTEKQHEGPLLTFVREQLLNATDTRQITGGGKKKASEERDYQLGRLFGILSVVRSGILSPGKFGENGQETTENAIAFAGLLVDLSHVKSMKEAASNAIITLLGAFYNLRDNEKAKAVVDDVVRNVIIPKLLVIGDATQDKHPLKVESFSAEQLAVAMYIQSKAAFHSNELPSPLDKPVLTLQAIPMIAPALCDSATTVGRDTKLPQVWASLLSLITEPFVEKKRNAGPTRRVLKDKIGGKETQEILGSVLHEAILMPLRSETVETGDKKIKNTQEHKALALNLIRILCGGEYLDSDSGSSFIDLEPSFVEEKVLCPEIVNLLLEVLTTSSGRAMQKKSVLELKPVAALVLESLVERAESSTDTTFSRRLAYARALVRCEPRFDARTETTVVSDLVMLGTSHGPVKGGLIPIWTEYVSFLVQEIIANAFEESRRSAAHTSTELEGGFTHKAVGLIDLLFSAGKQVIRMSDNSNDDSKLSMDTFKTNTIQRLLAFFMVSAFFKLSSLKDKDTSSDSAKKSKKKSKQRESTGKEQSAAEEAAILLKRSMKGNGDQVDCIPHSLRTILSSRYFSLLAEYVTFSPSNASNKEQKANRDDRAYGILSSVLDGWQALERQGAERFQMQEADNDEESEDREDPMTLVSKLRSSAEETSMSDEKERPKRRWKRSAAILEMTLSLHLLHHGSRETTSAADYEVEDDDEVESDEIIGFMSDLDKISNELVSHSKDTDENPLMGLAELSVGILTSPLGIGTPYRGASSKLVREIVKLSWTAGLSLCASSASRNKGCLLDREVIGLLLESMGVGLGHDMEIEPEDDGESDGEEGNDDGNDDEVDASKSVPKTESASEGGMEVEVHDDEVDDSDDDDDDDIMLDPSKLSTFLEDSDDDADMEDVLEHHQGADAALGKFIKAKQEARKAGQQARERVEMTNNLRNSMLLETLVSNPGKAWDSLLRSDVILSTLLPLLTCRNDLEKALAKAAEKGKNASDADKRALAERIGFLLKSKLCKMRLATSSISFSEGLNPAEFVSDLLGKLVAEASKSCTREQLACCSSAWVMVLRSLADPSQAILATQVHCQEAVRMWANQRNSGIKASLLEDLIQQIPSVAKATLAGPLANVATTSRNFLKAEAFRLLSLLYGIPSGQASVGTTEVDLAGSNQLEETTGNVVEAILASLDDKDMKAKRRRDVLKTLEKLVAWMAKESKPCSKQLASKLEELVNRLAEMGGTMETPAMKQQCERLSQDIRDICNKAQSAEVKVTEKGSGKKNKKSQSPKPKSNEGSVEKTKSPKPKEGGSSKKSKSPKPSEEGSSTKSKSPKPSEEGSSTKSKSPKPSEEGSGKKQSKKDKKT